MRSVPPSDDEGSVSLFNGKDLDGWIQRKGTATYRVEDETVVGTTAEGSPNSFLCTQQDYSDFELIFEVKVTKTDRSKSGAQTGDRAGRHPGGAIDTNQPRRRGSGLRADEQSRLRAA